MTEKKLKKYEKIIEEAYDNAARIAVKLDSGASDHFKGKLTLILFEKMLPPPWTVS